MEKKIRFPIQRLGRCALTADKMRQLGASPLILRP
jgi:hypothetical protein